MSNYSNGNINEEYEKDLRIGIWIPKSFNSQEKLVNLIKQHEILINGDSEIFTNNCDKLISDDTYKLLCKLNNVCILTTNFPYYTHVDISFSKKSGDSSFDKNRTLDISPFRFLTPISSPKYDLSQEEVVNETLMSVASVFIVLSKDDLRSKNIEFVKIYISEIIESFKTINKRIKFILIMNGIRDLVLANPGKTDGNNEINQNNSAHIQISMINELSSYLLVYQDVDTIETDDDSDLANVIALCSKSIRYSHSKRISSKFKSKPNQLTKDTTEISNKTWINQILQIPNIKNNEAETLSTMYNKPSEFIEFVLGSGDETCDIKSDINEIKTKKKLGKLTSKRLMKLYSYTLIPDETF